MSDKCMLVASTANVADRLLHDQTSAALLRDQNSRQRLKGQQQLSQQFGISLLLVAHFSFSVLHVSIKTSFMHAARQVYTQNSQYAVPV